MSMPTSTSSRGLALAGTVLRSDKIQPGHLERLAIVYVRQSSPQQVLKHQESARLQYGLAQRAEVLGWAAERVVVIDDDQGESGRHAESRTGFQRLVSEVSLDHVGIIFGIEMSRLARSNKDWHQLLELCALFRTLIADLDGVYDPAQYNDRLLLGLKGAMSEAELHILKQRMYEGRLSKARRGELSFALPVGYVWRDGAIVFDPDEQVQAVVRLLFRKFAELGTLHGLLRYLADRDIKLGVRVREGPGKGELVWRRPNRMTLQNVLKHPLFAGAYAYGRRQSDPRRQQPGRPSTGRVVMAPAEWLAFLPDQCPAYISMDQYEANLARLRENQARGASKGAVRPGPSLLAGLVGCARCRSRMLVRYGGQSTQHSYVCQRPASNYGGPHCQQISGPALDAYVVEQALIALQPAALELSLAAAEQVEAERAALDRLWQQRQERAAYDAERAAKQYHTVDPENRLVARTLERAWEEKLAAQQQLEEEYHRFQREQPKVLTAAEREAIRQVAANIPALWSAPTTTDADRKEILRQVLDRIDVDAQGATERVRVTLHWAGGEPTEGEVRRAVGRTDRLSSYQALCARLRTLAEEGWSATVIAERLTEEGFRPPKRQRGYSAGSINTLRQRLGLPAGRARRWPQHELAAHEWWSRDLAHELEMPKGTLDHWIGCGWARARRQLASPHRWIVWADATELERLRQLRTRSVADDIRRQWLDRPAIETTITAQPVS